MKSKKSYIKRFMKALRENEREEYRDIEVQVILNGEHVLEGGNYVIGGNAKVNIPNPWDTNVLVVDHGELTTDGRNGEDPYVFADDHGVVNISFGGSVSAKGNAHVDASWDVFIDTSENAYSTSLGCYVGMNGNSTGDIVDCVNADIWDNATAHVNGSGHIRCRDNSKVYLEDCDHVDAFDAAEVVASGACEIHAWRCSKVDARDNTTVYLYHDAECEPAEGGNVAIIKRTCNPWDYDDHR